VGEAGKGEEEGEEREEGEGEVREEEGEEDRKFARMGSLH
jgi:hypothetical protein